MNRNSLYLLFLAIIVSGCITTRSSLETEKQQTQIQQSLQKNRADFELRLDEMHEEQRNLLGRLEELEFKRKTQEEEVKKKSELQLEQGQKETEKLDLLVESMTKLETELQQQKQELELLKQQMSEIKASEVKDQDNGKKDSFSEAEEEFKKGSWREAALKYQRYREKNPRGKRVAEATYSMGLCFEKLKMPEEAKVFYEEVVQQFPKSKFASMAQSHLKKMRK